jgi:hypothetical protein
MPIHIKASTKEGNLIGEIELTRPSYYPHPQPFSDRFPIIPFFPHGQTQIDYDWTRINLKIDPSDNMGIILSGKGEKITRLYHDRIVKILTKESTEPTVTIEDILLLVEII